MLVQIVEITCYSGAVFSGLGCNVEDIIVSLWSPERMAPQQLPIEKSYPYVTSSLLTTPLVLTYPIYATLEAYDHDHLVAHFVHTMGLVQCPSSS
jgi:hypothetical protein